MTSEVRVPESPGHHVAQAVSGSEADTHAPSSNDVMPYEREGAWHATASLRELVDQVPEGWTLVAYEGRPYGLTRTTRAQGQSISISAEELGGDELISANVYRTRNAEHLRPCEIPEAKVLEFLRGWAPR